MQQSVGQSLTVHGPELDQSCACAHIAMIAGLGAASYRCWKARSKLNGTGGYIFYAIECRCRERPISWYGLKQIGCLAKAFKCIPILIQAYCAKNSHLISHDSLDEWHVLEVT